MSVFKIKQMCQLPSTIWSLISVQTTESPRGSQLLFEDHRPSSPHHWHSPLLSSVFVWNCPTSQSRSHFEVPTHQWRCFQFYQYSTNILPITTLEIHWRERTFGNRTAVKEPRSICGWLPFHAVPPKTSRWAGELLEGQRASWREKNKTYVLLLACYMVINTTVPLRFHVFWAKLKKVVALEATINRTINHCISSLNRPSFHLVLLLLYFKKMTCNHAQQEKKDLDSPRMHLSSGLVETRRSRSCWCHNVL